MASHWTPLSFEQHGHMRVNAEGSIRSLMKTNMVTVVVSELASIAAELPVFFVKNSETGSFELVALMGFSVDSNVFFDNGVWRGIHIPYCVQNLPFVMASVEEDKYVLCVDESSDQFNAHIGQPLFEASGDQTEYLMSIVKKLLDYKSKQETTARYLETLLEFDLLAEQNLTLDLVGSESVSIGGVYQVDMKRLSQLADDKFIELRRRGFLTAVYAQLLSMQKLRELARLNLAVS
ncbi:SapC family protein [Simiduia curdlanivorans]|uniref:SapC family protein n=1 Tax=Simiduia curdlanivorans TaxID=1492769 RepID=A0ABV8V293_9GAMM|nr:SapC family protein [Simiduia curdlanivorans]MDN3640208.1 SapC family protein [Simiduia curdlanivorans]